MMQSKYFLSALLLLLSACSEPPYRTALTPSPSSPPQLPDLQCRGKLPEVLKERFEDYRLVEESDFVASIRQYNPPAEKSVTCSIYTADFNSDGHKEYAVLLINPKTSESRFELLLNRGNGEFGTSVVKTFQPPPEAKDGVVYTTIQFKGAGEAGPASRDYFPLKPGTPERENFIKNPAIELWQPIDTTSNGVPKDLELSTLAFCSRIVYFAEGTVQNITVCD
jgi:hypothetical protein